MVTGKENDLLELTTGGSRKSSVNEEEKFNEMEAQEQHRRAGEINDNFGEFERARVTENRSNELNHAKCVVGLAYNKFSWTDEELESFHRGDFNNVWKRL